MFTNVFGLNLVSLIGLLMTAFGLSVVRMSPGRRLWGVALMAVGTALVFAGFYLSDHPP